MAVEYDLWDEDPDAAFADVLWGENEGVVETKDGCEVEPDGVCPHGYQSPMLERGFI